MPQITFEIPMGLVSPMDIMELEDEITGISIEYVEQKNGQYIFDAFSMDVKALYLLGIQVEKLLSQFE